MALIPVQAANYPFLAPTYAAAAAGDQFSAGDNLRLVVKNASGAPVNITISSFPDTSPWGAAMADLVVAVPATTGERWIGPFRGPAHADPATGLVSVTYSALPSVTVALVAIV